MKKLNCGDVLNLPNMTKKWEGISESVNTTTEISSAPTEKGKTMRLIDANALIEEANAEGAYGYVDAFQIANAPTVDAVEVVRCKDCLYSTERDGHLCCIHGVSYRKSWNKPDFFCSRGERRC